jgi:hypothetical protein
VDDRYRNFWLRGPYKARRFDAAGFEQRNGATTSSHVSTKPCLVDFSFF